MSSQPSTSWLRIDHNITLSDLYGFTQKLEQKSELHGKRQKDGSYLLYVSKGKGTGFKRTFFPETIEARRISAHAAVLKVTKKSSTAARGAGLVMCIKKDLITEELPTEKQVFYDYEVMGSEPLIVENVIRNLYEAVNSETMQDFKTLGLQVENGKVITPFPYEKNNDATQAFRRYEKGCQLIPRYRAFNIFYSADGNGGVEQKMSRLFEAGLEGKPEKIIAAASEFLTMMDDLGKAAVDRNLFKNKDFTKQFGERQDKILQLGADLETLYATFNRPDSSYRSLYRLAVLATNSPETFTLSLNEHAKIDRYANTGNFLKSSNGPDHAIEFRAADAVKALGFHITKGRDATRAEQCSHFFKDIKDIISEISPKSSEALCKELIEDGLITEAVPILMEEKDARTFRIFEAEAEVTAAAREKALEDTDQNNFAKLWKKIQHGAKLIPKDKADYRRFEAVSVKYQELLGARLFEVNVGMNVLGVGLDIDRSFNLILDKLGEIVMESSKSTLDIEKAKEEVVNAATKEGDLDQRLDKLKFGARLLTNPGYLKELPKHMRDPLEALGHNMARAVKMFERPDGQFQSLKRVLEAATDDPQGFIKQVRREIAQPNQLTQSQASTKINLDDGDEVLIRRINE